MDKIINYWLYALVRMFIMSLSVLNTHLCWNLVCSCL